MVKRAHERAGLEKLGGCAQNSCVCTRNIPFHRREHRERRGEIRSSFTAESAEIAEKSVCSVLHHPDCPPYFRLNKLRKEVSPSQDLLAAGAGRAFQASRSSSMDLPTAYLSNLNETRDMERLRKSDIRFSALSARISSSVEMHIFSS
jgi:hypothetical protein